MDKIYVQIVDKGSVFYDGGVCILGAEPVEVTPTARILDAIKGGALRKLDTKEGAALVKHFETKKVENDNEKSIGFVSTSNTNSGNTDGAEQKEVETKTVKAKKSKKAKA